MIITEVTPQGYCGGVKAAIEKVQNYKKHHPDQPVTILGALVHNRHVSEMLAAQGIQTLEKKGASRLELLDEIEKGTVVFTAHGVHDDVRRKAEAKGLQILDASCPFVAGTQKIIQQQRKTGASVLYIGKKGHPEAEAALLDEGVYLIEKEEDIPAGLQGSVFVTNQTTMSIMETQSIFDAIRCRYPQANFHDEICNATRVRQQAVLGLQGKGIDALVVVGDPSSNNTRKLAQTGIAAGIPHIFQVENARDIDPELFKGICHAALTSGASTPAALKDEVAARLRSLPDQNPQT